MVFHTMEGRQQEYHMAENAEVADKKKRNKLGMILGVCIVVVAVAAICIAVLWPRNQQPAQKSSNTAAMSRDEPPEIPNKALFKPVTQSSNKPHLLLEKYMSGYLAVDGDTITCSSTEKDAKPWWAVDLKSSFKVQSVFITNRDKFPERLSNFVIGTTFLEPTDPTVSSITLCAARGDEPVGEKREFQCDEKAFGRWVVILMQKQQYLTLCEVEVYGTDLCVTTTTTTTPAPTYDKHCEDGWSKLKDRCYRLVSPTSLNRNREYANLECQKVKGKLATLSNEEESNFVASLMEGINLVGAWLGLRKSSSTCDDDDDIQCRRLNWSWDDETPYDHYIYHHWDKDEPKMLKIDSICARIAIHPTTWVAERCSSERSDIGYICEKASV